MAGTYVGRATIDSESGLVEVEVAGVGVTQAESWETVLEEVTNFICLSTDEEDPSVMVVALPRARSGHEGTRS